MSKLTNHFFTVAVIFLIGIFGVAGWYFYKESQKPQIILPNARWEQIFFKEINNATKLSGLEDLRKISLGKADVEIRVWRGFSLDPLEAVILKRIDGIWTAFHIKTDNYDEATKAEVKRLNKPKSGWESFWKSIEEKGILTLPDAFEINCEVGGIDAMSYVVEINQDKTYRTYRYSDEKCNQVEQMEEIGEIIGEEFDSGNEECKTTEWFACMTLRKSLNQTTQ
jgi:hypothetical protein